MPAPTLIFEDGTGITGANTYATTDMFSAYTAANLYADAWTAASVDRRAVALLMASRHIDAQLEFWGVRLTTTQGLEWPRMQGRPIPAGAWPFTYGPAYPSREVIPDPRRLQDAACELALQLLSYNYTADPDEKGVKSFSIGQGAVAVTFDPKDRKSQFPAVVESLLTAFGTLRYNRANVSIRRVQ